MPTVFLVNGSEKMTAPVGREQRLTTQSGHTTVEIHSREAILASTQRRARSASREAQVVARRRGRSVIRVNTRSQNAKKDMPCRRNPMSS